MKSLRMILEDCNFKMKKLLGIIVLGLLFSSYSYANIFNDIFKSSMERCADDNATMSDYVAISDWKFVPKNDKGQT